MLNPDGAFLAVDANGAVRPPRRRLRFQIGGL